MTRILLVEDDQSLGATLQERLVKENYHVVWRSSVQLAIQAARAESFALYILDVGLPDGTGFELAEELLRISSAPILFLTAQGDAESRLRGYELGAEEYIPKPFHLRELLLRVRHVLDNHTRAHILNVGNVKVDFSSYELARSGQSENVPAKDLQLLQLLVESAPRVVSRDEALNRLWGEDKFPSARTVDNSILRLRSALGEPVARCIESVRGVGYRWNTQSSKVITMGESNE